MGGVVWREWVVWGWKGQMRWSMGGVRVCMGGWEGDGERRMGEGKGRGGGLGGGPCGPSWAPWALAGPALVGRALMGEALVGLPRPWWAPWALAGWALAGRAFVGQALVGLPHCGPPWAIVMLQGPDFERNSAAGRAPDEGEWVTMAVGYCMGK